MIDILIVFIRLILLQYLPNGMNLRNMIGKIYDKMSKPAYVFDGRNVLEKEELESIGFNYIGLGR